MRVDLIQSENWDSANMLLQHDVDAFAGRSLKKNLRVFKGLNHAIYEIAIGNGQLFSHKRAVGVINGNTPFFKDIKQSLYKDGFSVQSINLSELTDTKNWIDSLKKETNYVLFSSDHPLTGETFQDWSKLDLELNEKKIFSIRVSHADWLFNIKNPQFEIRPYSIHILSLTPDLAVALCGEKFKSLPLMARHMFWDVAELQKLTKNIFATTREDKTAVQKFESNLPKGWQPLLSAQNTARVFDRAIIYNLQINSEAVMREICRAQKYEINAPGFSAKVESANLCRWGGMSLYDHWWPEKPADDVIRGLLVLSVSAIQDPSIYKALEAATLAVQL